MITRKIVSLLSVFTCFLVAALNATSCSKFSEIKPKSLGNYQYYNRVVEEFDTKDAATKYSKIGSSQKNIEELIYGTKGTNNGNYVLFLGVTVKNIFQDDRNAVIS
jgi:hypothetical protein